MIEDLREHIKMVSGEMYSDEIKDDTIEAVISQKRACNTEAFNR